jgi:hypothetical protein
MKTTTKQHYGRKMMVLDDIYGLSWTWSSLIPVTLVQIMEGTSSKCKKKK